MKRITCSVSLAFTLACLRRQASIIAAAVLLFPAVARSQNPEWMVYNADNSGLPHNSVRALVIDAQGNIWIGTYGGGLAEVWPSIVKVG